MRLEVVLEHDDQTWPVLWTDLRTPEPARDWCDGTFGPGWGTMEYENWGDRRLYFKFIFLERKHAELFVMRWS